MKSLTYFDITQGNWIGAKVIIDEFGFVKGSQYIAKLKWREAFDNPFKKLNKGKKLSNKEQLSQQQMAPLVIMYQLLLQDDVEQEKAIEFCKTLAKEVAVAFLDFTVPQITKQEFEGKSQTVQLEKLKKIAVQFFNISESTPTVKPNDRFELPVLGCYFATYAKQLGMPELGPVFCAADGYYFEHYQKQVKFMRSQTLAEGDVPYCNFAFEWKD